MATFIDVHDGFFGATGEQLAAAHAADLAAEGAEGVHFERCWLDPEAGVALGHRRLSILDLSPAGHQPMVSASGRYVVVLNGEIYNHLEIRERLDAAESAPHWRSCSSQASPTYSGSIPSSLRAARLAAALWSLWPPC